MGDTSWPQEARARKKRNWQKHNTEVWRILKIQSVLGNNAASAQTFPSFSDSVLFDGKQIFWLVIH